MIEQFIGHWRCLSNFWPAPVVFEGEVYPTVEHAYQAAKTLDVISRLQIRQFPTAGQAKKHGKTVMIRSNWEIIKLEVMLALLRAKFKHLDLRMQLLATEEEELVEGNYWHDTFWGIDLKTGVGYNHLGRLLMKVRQELRDNGRTKKSGKDIQ